MTTRTGIRLFIHALACAWLAYHSLTNQNGFGALAFMVAALVPMTVRQKRTALMVCALLVVLAVFVPKTALGLLAALWLGFLLLPKVPVPPTKAEMAELKQAAHKSKETQELGNVRVMPSGSTYVVDKHGSWRRVKAS